MTGAQRLAQQHGFQFLRYARGSHQIWVHANGQTVLVCRNKGGKNLQNFRAELKRKSRN